MKFSIAAIALITIVAASGCSTNGSLAPSASNPQAVPADAEALVAQAFEEQRLKQVGVQPGTKKAGILLKWQRSLLNAPDIKARFPTGLPSPQSPAGAIAMADGLSRITPAQRAEFWSLYARVAAAHLPDDCYGQRESPEISRRLMSFPNFTDDETDEYMGLVAAILHADARQDPVQLPTVADHSAAVIVLGRVMSSEVRSKADADRIARVSVNRAAASVTDICWVTKVSIRAIDKLPPKEKEVLLVTSFHQLAAPAAKMLPWPAAPAPALKAAPASAKQL